MQRGPAAARDRRAVDAPAGPAVARRLRGPLRRHDDHDSQCLERAGALRPDGRGGPAWRQDDLPPHRHLAGRILAQRAILAARQRGGVSGGASRPEAVHGSSRNPGHEARPPHDLRRHRPLGSRADREGCRPQSGDMVPREPGRRRRRHRRHAVLSARSRPGRAPRPAVGEWPGSSTALLQDRLHPHRRRDHPRGPVHRHRSPRLDAPPLPARLRGHRSRRPCRCRGDRRPAQRVRPELRARQRFTAPRGDGPGVCRVRQSDRPRPARVRRLRDSEQHPVGAAEVQRRGRPASRPPRDHQHLLRPARLLEHRAALQPDSRHQPVRLPHGQPLAPARQPPPGHLAARRLVRAVIARRQGRAAVPDSQAGADVRRVRGDPRHARPRRGDARRVLALARRDAPSLGRPLESPPGDARAVRQPHAGQGSVSGATNQGGLRSDPHPGDGSPRGRRALAGGPGVWPDRPAAVLPPRGVVRGGESIRTAAGEVRDSRAVGTRSDRRAGGGRDGLCR